MWRLFGSKFRSAALCLGPAAALGHVAPTAHCVKSKHAAAEHAKNEEARRSQYAEAMEYCNGDASKAYSASMQRADDGEAPRWPLISYRGLHDRLLGKVDNAQPFAHSAVLTVAEEAAIVEACKDLNRHHRRTVRESRLACPSVIHTTGLGTPRASSCLSQCLSVAKRVAPV